MELLFLTILIVGAAMAVMAVGMVFGNRCLRGSCGGPELLGPDGESLTCPTCPHRPQSAEEADPALDSPA